jgi:uncharacterized protein (DUF2147 family)
MRQAIPRHCGGRRQIRRYYHTDSESIITGLLFCDLRIRKTVEEIIMVILKNIFVIAFALAALSEINFRTAYADDINADSIVGKWKDPDGPAVVQIENKGGYYEGVVVENTENPGVVSTAVFKNLVYDAADGIWEGTVYSIKKSKDFNVKIRMDTANNFTMTVKAGLGSKKLEWSRVE